MKLLLVLLALGLCGAIPTSSKKAVKSLQTTTVPSTTEKIESKTEKQLEIKTKVESEAEKELSTPSNCPICQPDKCPATAQECSHGLIKDDCGCCKIGVCVLLEKEKCLDLNFSKDIIDAGLKRYSVCGQDMECSFRKDIKAGEVPEAVCLCQKEEISCGKDNTTYKSICQLRQANTELKHSGACTTPPTIVLSEEENMSLDEHERFALNCEAKAYPVPDIRWEFEGANGLFKTLPGDDAAVVVHNRGGPESFTVSSWVMIESVRYSDAGTYICVAKNSEGEARSVLTLNIKRKNS